MAALENGQWLNQYVAPQLLDEFRNYKDDFMGVLGGAPAAAISADGIRFNKLINNVKFSVNNTTGFTPTRMDGQRTIIPWEKYDTAPTQVDDAEIRSLNYDKRAQVRVKHSEAFRIGIRDHVMWKLCPENFNNANMPCIRTTGADDGTGRKRLLFKDIVEYLERFKKLNLPDSNSMYMILCPQHATDLILDRDSANYFSNSNVFFDPVTGNVKSIMGFKFFENNQYPLFDKDGNKKAEGAVAAAGDQPASLAFYAPNTVYHLNQVKILYKPETTDTRNADPTSEFRLQVYGLVDRIQDYGFGAIVSGNVAAATPGTGK